jgi:hypothetical protein
MRLLLIPLATVLLTAAALDVARVATAQARFCDNYGAEVCAVMLGDQP